MRNTTLTLVATVLFCACAPGELRNDGPGSLRAPIVGGKTHTGHPSVGLLHRMSGYICTATLVGKQTVLTAGHCVDPSTTHYFIVDGDWHSVSWVQQHPSYDAANHHTNDLAIVRLAQPLGIAPSAVSSLPPSKGQTVTLVGFGKTAEGADDSGTKRIATNTVASIYSTTIEYYGAGGNICNGDSGGPGFATIQGQEVQVGVHSLKLGDCGYGGVDTRVDAFKDWIVKTAGGDVEVGPTKPEPEPEPEPTPPTPPTPPSPGDADGDGIPDAEDLCSNTPAGATVWTSGKWKGCAGGQNLDPTPPQPQPEPEPQPKPQPGNDADGDGIPDAQDQCDQTPAAWIGGVHKTGNYLGCYPNGDVITG